MIKITEGETAVRLTSYHTSSVTDLLSRLEPQAVLVSRYSGLQKEACVMAMTQ